VSAGSPRSSEGTLPYRISGFAGQACARGRAVMDAENAAWAAPGVAAVDNRIVVDALAVIPA